MWLYERQGGVNSLLHMDWDEMEEKAAKAASISADALVSKLRATSDGTERFEYKQSVSTIYLFFFKDDSPKQTPKHNIISHSSTMRIFHKKANSSKISFSKFF